MLQVDGCNPGWFLYQCCSFGGMTNLPFPSFSILYKQIIFMTSFFHQELECHCTITLFFNYGWIKTQNILYTGAQLEEL